MHIRHNSSGPAETGHLPALDGLRGVAILSVLATHLLASNGLSPNPLIQAVLSIRDQLWMGVTLFFSLSGFLITGILYDTLDTHNFFRAFYGRRILRIFPLYYGFLGVLLLLTPVLGLDWHRQAWRLLTYTPNIPFMSDWSVEPGHHIALRHFWSLAVEEQFYLVWPVLIFFLRGWRPIVAACFTGSLLALGFRTALALSGQYPQNHTLPGCMDGLLLGAALALLARSPWRAPILRAGPWVALPAIGSTFVLAFVNPTIDWGNSLYLTTLGMTVTAIGTTAFVAASLNPGSHTQRFLSNPFLRFFGTYSYGLYVYHYTIDALFTNRLRAALEAHGAGKAVAILAVAVPVLLLSVAVSWLSYQFFEKRFLNLKRFFRYERPVHTEELGETALEPTAAATFSS